MSVWLNPIFHIRRKDLKDDIQHTTCTVKYYRCRLMLLLAYVPFSFFHIKFAIWSVEVDTKGNYLVYEF